MLQLKLDIAESDLSFSRFRNLLTEAPFHLGDNAISFMNENGKRFALEWNILKASDRKGRNLYRVNFQNKYIKAPAVFIDGQLDIPPDRLNPGKKSTQINIEAGTTYFRLIHTNALDGSLFSREDIYPVYWMAIDEIK